MAGATQPGNTLRFVKPLRWIVSWLFTIPTLLLFFGALLVGDVALRIARLFGDRPMEVTAGAIQRVLMWTFLVSGTRFVIERSPLVEERQGYLFVSNHQSLIDIPLFGGVLFSNYPKYVAKRELGRWLPTISFNLRRGGNVLIDRANRLQAMRAIRDFGNTVQQRGVSAVLFPEGSRSRDGELKEFRPGGLAALLRAADEMPVVPTVIDGSWKLLRHKMMPIPFGTRVRIRFLDPIQRVPGEDVADLLARVRGEIETVLDTWRAESVPAARL